MADSTPTPISTTTPNTQLPQMQEKGAKKAFFGGGQNVFDNLEKFERISNPLPEHQDFDFTFENLEEGEAEQEGNTDQKAQEAPGQAEIPEFGEELDQATQETLAPLENRGLENIFQAEEPMEQSEEATFDLDLPETPVDEEHPLEEETTEEGNGEEENGEAENLLEEEEVLVTEETEDPQDSTEEADIFIENAEEDSSLEETDSDEEADTLEKADTSEETIPPEEKDAETEAHLAMEKEPHNEFSPLMQNYFELVEMSKRILSLENKIEKTEKSDFELIGNNTEKSMIRYLICEELTDGIPSLNLKKIEKDFARDEEKENTLIFTSETATQNLLVKVDGFQLYEEEKDLQDPIKQLQVLDKLKKFYFLFSEKINELEEKRESIKAEKERMKAFRAIFRNF